TIDLIATDHAPHAADEKEQAMDCAPFGIIGLETALPLSLELVEKGVLSLPEVIQKLTTEPAQVLGKKIGRLDIGGTADLTLIDPEIEWIVEAQTIKSMSKNSPFIGRAMKGRAAAVIVGGTLIENETVFKEASK
ncbi:MAG: amidohydrolase family protein, partial [Nitrospiria bacterium]